MTAAAVNRFTCGPAQFPGPAVRASGVTPPPWLPGPCLIPYADGRGLVTWTGGEFGLTTANGAAGTSAQVTITHRVSDPTAFPVITAQLLADGEPVGRPAALTPSSTYVTETVQAETGITPANLASLQVRVTWQQAAMGIAYISHSIARTPGASPGAESGLFLGSLI